MMNPAGVAELLTDFYGRLPRPTLLLDAHPKILGAAHLRPPGPRIGEDSNEKQR